MDLLTHYNERIAAKQAELDAFIPQADGDIARREKLIAQMQQELQQVLQQYRNQSARLQGAIDVLKEERDAEQARLDAERKEQEAEQAHAPSGEQVLAFANGKADELA